MPQMIITNLLSRYFAKPKDMHAVAISKLPVAIIFLCPTFSMMPPTIGETIVPAIAYEANIKPVQVEETPTASSKTGKNGLAKP